MKKTLAVLSLILVIAFVLVSCEEGLPDSITSVMGIMGNNILGVDTSKVEGAVNDAKPVSQSTSGTYQFGDQEVTFDSENGKIKVGDYEIDATIPEVIMFPSDNLASIVDVLESNAKEAMQKELSQKVDEEDLAAVQGTAFLIESALDAALGAAGDADDPAVQALQSIKDSLVPPADHEYTKADALVLQALTNVVFSAAETVSEVVSDEKDPDPAKMIGDIYPDLMALNSICQNSGSSLNLDLAGIVDQLTK